MAANMQVVHDRGLRPGSKSASASSELRIASSSWSRAALREDLLRDGALPPLPLPLGIPSRQYHCQTRECRRLLVDKPTDLYCTDDGRGLSRAELGVSVIHSNACTVPVPNKGGWGTGDTGSRHANPLVLNPARPPGRPPRNTHFSHGAGRTGAVRTTESRRPPRSTRSDLKRKNERFVLLCPYHRVAVRMW